MVEACCCSGDTGGCCVGLLGKRYVWSHVDCEILTVAVERQTRGGIHSAIIGYWVPSVIIQGISWFGLHELKMHDVHGVVMTVKKEDALGT